MEKETEKKEGRGSGVKYSLELFEDKVEKYLKKYEVYKGWRPVNIKNDYLNRVKNEYKILFINEEGFMSRKALSGLKIGSKFLLYYSRENISTRNMLLHLHKNTTFSLKKEQSYIGSRKNYVFICPIHGEFTTTWNRMLHHIDFYDKKEYSGMGCHGCYLDISGGESSPHWNAELTNEQRQQNRDDAKNREWRARVYKRDDYICQCCKIRGGRLEAHHKDSFQDNVEARYDLNNGVTLCVSCHRTGKYAYHKLFGNKNSTKEKYKEWIQQYQKIIIADIAEKGG